MQYFENRLPILSDKRPRRTGRTMLATALLSSAALIPAVASAQEYSDRADANEIIVTAQFREQNLQSTPIAITALSGDQLEARGQTSIVDIAQKAPSVNLRESNPQGPALQAHIRGIGQSDSSAAFEPGVGLYVDDVYYSTMTGSVLDLLDLERVEVLRGPQGTLAGMNSIGGAIKLYTKKPQGDDGGFVEVAVGNYNRVDVRAGADFTIVPDRLFARVSGVSRNQDGYVTRYDFACTHPELAATYTIPSKANGSGCKLGSEGGRSYVGGRASLRFVPNDSIDITISGDITRDDSEAAVSTLTYVGRFDGDNRLPGTGGTNQTYAYPMYLTAPNNGLNLWNPVTGTSPFVSHSPFPDNVAGDTFTKSPYITYATYCSVDPVDKGAPYCAEPKSGVNSWGLSGNVEVRLSDNLVLTSITSYRENDATWVQDYDATLLSNALIDYESTAWQFSQELRLAANLFDDAVNLVVGAFYLDRASTFAATIDHGLQIFTEYDEIPASNWAVFANASWKLTDKLELNAGIRYSEEEKIFRFFRGGRGGIPSVNNPPYFPCVVNGVDYGIVHAGFCPLNGVEGVYKGDNIDWRAVLQYQWSDDIMTYASVATGYKGGGVNPRPYTAAQAYPFNPEKLTAFEVGAKTSFLDRRARFNVSAFVNKYSDFIAAVFSRVAAAPNETCYMSPNDLTCSYFVNSGKATLKGLEAELTLEPVDNLLIDASGSILDFKYDKLSGCSPLLDPSCTSPFGGLGAGLRYGMELSYAPKRQFSAGIQYKIDMGGAGSLTPRVDFSYQSGQHTDAINHALAWIDGHSVVNARLAWDSADSDWQVALQVTNLTDELYYLDMKPNNNSATTVGAPARPRQWWVSVKRNF